MTSPRQVLLCTVHVPWWCSLYARLATPNILLGYNEQMNARQTGKISSLEKYRTRGRSDDVFFSLQDRTMRRYFAKGLTYYHIMSHHVEFIRLWVELYVVIYCKRTFNRVQGKFRLLINNLKKYQIFSEVSRDYYM